MLKPYIAKVINNTNLPQDDAYQAMEIIMSGKATPAQIGGYLVGLRMKGETVAEITGSAAAMRAAAEQITPGVNDPLIDTAGTGGDGSIISSLGPALRGGRFRKWRHRALA